MSPAESHRARPSSRAVVGRLLGMAFLWWVLVEGDLHRAWFGAGISVVATAISFGLWPQNAWRWNPIGLLTFVPYFFWHSFLGGVDVARRAFMPSLPLEPRLIHLRMRLGYEPAQVFFAWVLGLFPGTAGVRLRDGTLAIHILRSQEETEKGIRKLEERVARLFGIPSP